jgi:hypothetical protein
LGSGLYYASCVQAEQSKKQNDVVSNMPVVEKSDSQDPNKPYASRFPMIRKKMFKDARAEALTPQEEEQLKIELETRDILDTFAHKYGKSFTNLSREKQDEYVAQYRESVRKTCEEVAKKVGF